MKATIQLQSDYRRQSNRLSGITPDPHLTLEKCSRSHAKTIDIACLVFADNQRGFIITCSTCPKAAWLDMLMMKECSDLPLALTHMYEAKSVDEGFALINRINPDDNRLWFNCEGAFKLLARKAFSVNRGSAGLEEKRLAIKNGVALRYTCRNTSRKPHICEWQIRADYRNDIDLWVLKVNEQNHTTACHSHIPAVTYTKKSHNRKASKMPKSPFPEAKARLEIKKDVRADRYYAKVLLEFKRFGRVDEWHPKRRLRRLSQVAEQLKCAEVTVKEEFE